MTKTRTLRDFRKLQPRRYQPVPTILQSVAAQTAQAITDSCGAEKPKIREVAVEVDFKGKVPKATVRSRYLRKWSKVAEFPIEPKSGFDFQPALALR